ncbi:hypothetical protein LZ31DRAFT_188915 [Colletotrichum somersetense]|nr:hypothetical protein LZ31DRAFT_188915 [Colletotrichum somersetense]
MLVASTPHSHCCWLHLHAMSLLPFDKSDQGRDTAIAAKHSNQRFVRCTGQLARFDLMQRQCEASHDATQPSDTLFPFGLPTHLLEACHEQPPCVPIYLHYPRLSHFLSASWTSKPPETPDHTNRTSRRSSRSKLLRVRAIE